MALKGRSPYISQIYNRSHSSILVYISSYPKGIVEKIRKYCSIFLRKGGCEDKGYHMVGWKIIATPKARGGWGLKYIHNLGK